MEIGESSSRVPTFAANLASLAVKTSPLSVDRVKPKRSKSDKAESFTEAGVCRLQYPCSMQSDYTAIAAGGSLPRQGELRRCPGHAGDTTRVRTLVARPRYRSPP